MTIANATETNPTSFPGVRTAARHHLPHSSRTRDLETLRSREFARLDKGGHVYLDYTGGALYAESQLRAHMELLGDAVLGNPHSTSPASQAATELAEQARAAVLHYFNAAPDEYVVVFTPNASAALKLVGEAYPFGSEDRYLLTVDNHNSVNGIREFARTRGAATSYVQITPPELRIDAAALRAGLNQGRPGRNNLFAYPAQSNFSGVTHDLEWISEAQAKGWDVLLDASAFVSSNRLDLGRWHPDFVALSFYKLFGYPTGVGCLIARRESLAKLRRPWFAGGTVTVASVHGDGHVLHEDATAFEDGTINYLSLPAVEIGLRFIESIGIETIHTHVADLTEWLLGQLASLRHSTDIPLVRIYGPLSTERRGGTIALNLNDRQGNLIDFRMIERRANAANISLRTGCFCNPGVSEVIGGLTQVDLESFFRARPPMAFSDFLSAIGISSPGAVRVSFGLPSNLADAQRFVEFATGYLR